MYNLNVNVSAAGTPVNNLLAVESACTTPRTPEILNSLIAMTNPLDGYSFSSQASKKGSCLQNISQDSNSSSGSTQGENSGCATNSNNSPPSVQHTCSQLIKAGLKLSIESKRKHSADNDDFLDMDLNAKRIKKIDYDDDDLDRSQSPHTGLTPEDEERRRRRRERNKIAATKCRLKKREKTVNLVQESETLESQNVDLKSQIQELEKQRRRLVDMLAMHSTSCMKPQKSDHYTTAHNHNPNRHHAQQPQDNSARYLVEEDSHGYSPESGHHASGPSVIEVNYGCSRPSSVDIGPNFRTQNNLEYCTSNNEIAYSRSSLQYSKPPTIIVEEENYSPPSQLTNLDNTTDSLYHYNSQQCHNYNASNGQNQNYGNANLDNGCMA